jgi:sugar lactone lactonase YvrE
MDKNYYAKNHFKQSPKPFFKAVGLVMLLVALTSLASQAQYTYKNTIGSSGTGSGQFDGPFGTAISADSNLYVTDYHNNRVQVFDIDGAFLFSFGSSGSGDGQFNYPTDVAFDPSGNVYVAQNDRVQIFTPTGVFIRKIAVESAYGLAIDSTGILYVICAFEVKKFDQQGVLLKSFGSYGSGDGQFDNAYKGVIDRNGHLCVVELFNYRVQIFDSEGTFITKFGAKGAGDGQFSYPSGIALDGAGNFYIADQGNHRVQVFNSAGEFKKKFGSLGSTHGKFTNPVRVTLDAWGNIYVTDNSNNRIEIFSKTANAISNFENIEKTYGDESFELQAQSLSSANVTYREVEDSEFTGDVSIDGAVVSIVKAGNVKLRAYAADDLEFAGAYKDVTLTINKAQQTITFGELAPRILGTADFQISAVASSGEAVLFSSSNESVAIIEGNTVTLTGAGETTITASQSGNGNYEAAEEKQQLLTVLLITGNEESLDNVVKIFPNPAAQYVSVKGSVNLSVGLMDDTGREISVPALVSGDTTQLDLRTLTTGVYYLQFSNGQQRFVKRIVKQ